MVQFKHVNLYRKGELHNTLCYVMNIKMKFEKEVKILDIDIDDAIERLKKIGAEFKGKKEQKIYVYDVPTIYYRYLEICELLKSSNKLMVTTNIGKLKILLEELVDLIPDNELKKLENELGVEDIINITDLPVNEMIEKLENEIFLKQVANYKINPNKWIRLRKSNDKIELTTKHVFEKKNMKVQAVGEREINTSSFEETNNILESIGILKRSYQEKVRYTYKFNGADIEIDIWPMLKPYIEIECEDVSIIEDIIEKLEYTNKEIVSINTQQLYNSIGINLQEISELKF